jgi:hypothetical protein
MTVNQPAPSAEGTTIQSIRLIPLPPGNGAPIDNADYYAITGVTGPQRPSPPPTLMPEPAPEQTMAPPSGSIQVSKAAPESALSGVAPESAASKAASVPAPQPDLVPRPDSPVPGPSHATSSNRNDQPVVLVTPLSYKDIVAKISYPIPGSRVQKTDKARPARRKGNRGRTPTPWVPMVALTIPPESPVSPDPDVPTGDLITLSDSPERLEGPRLSLQITMEAGAGAVREHSSPLDDLLFD